MTNAGPPAGGDWGAQNPGAQNPSAQNPSAQNPSAPGPYGAPTPPNGQPAPGAPAAGQPAYGQPAYGQPAYGQPGYPPPAPPAKSKTPMIIIGAIVAAVAALGIILAVTLTGGSDDGEFTVDGSKKVAEQYFQDIEDQDPDHAKTLLCTAQKSAFEDTLDSPNSDFDFTFTDITFKEGSKDGARIKVVYDLVGYLTEDKSTEVDVELTFTLIDENGPKLCGESGAAN